MQQEVELQEMEHSLGEKSKESADMQARWNLENFKYNLLVDMVTASSGSALLSSSADRH